MKVNKAINTTAVTFDECNECHAASPMSQNSKLFGLIFSLSWIFEETVIKPLKNFTKWFQDACVKILS